jgi:hypothetical protein
MNGLSDLAAEKSLTVLLYIASGGVHARSG